MLNIKTFTVNPLQENCYVASDETRECIIIDCGAYSPAEQQTVINYIKENRLTPKHHILTHAHADHCAGGNAISKAFGLQMEVHLADEPTVKGYSEMYRYVFGEPAKEAPPVVARYFTERDTIAFGTHTFTIMAAPGHSPGSVVFYCAAEKAAFTGDTLFAGSIGRTDFPGGSMFLIIQSLRALCQLPDDVKVYPGHGAGTTIGCECASNPFIDR
ncbi:MAG: MBL fold metallo-hydrolase [Prevotella sp.]|nr:MBL fold metallo-hydrolase [Prevotella sp.]